MTEEKVKIKNVYSNVKISGSGEPILILHGWGVSSDVWDSARQIFSNNNYRVISADFPGFGNSDNPDYDWNLDDYLDWTLKLAEYCELSNFNLIGHSFGGRVAIKMASSYPEKIKNLVLCDPAGIKINPSFKTQLVMIIAELGSMFFRPKFMRYLKNHVREIFFSFIKRRDYVQANSLMQKVMKNVLREDLAPNLPLIKNKTLVIWGKEDQIIHVKYSEVFKKFIKDVRVEILPGIGHSPHVEALVPFCQIVDDFLIK